jgi:hypothetical protein
MAKKAGGIAPFEILARIHFNLQVAVCPAKIWSVLRTYHNYINPNRDEFVHHVYFWQKQQQWNIVCTNMHHLF